MLRRRAWDEQHVALAYHSEFLFLHSAIVRLCGMGVNGFRDLFFKEIPSAWFLRRRSWTPAGGRESNGQFGKELSIAGNSLSARVGLFSWKMAVVAVLLLPAVAQPLHRPGRVKALAGSGLFALHEDSGGRHQLHLGLAEGSELTRIPFRFVHFSVLPSAR